VKVKLHVIFRLFTKTGVCRQREEYESIDLEGINRVMHKLYLQQRTAKDFVRITLDIALPED
jgi:hypothetical protein